MHKGCQFLVVVAVLRDLFCPPGLYNPKIGTLYLNQNKTQATYIFCSCHSPPLVAHRCAPFVTSARLCRGLSFARDVPARGVSLPQAFLGGVPTVGSIGDGQCRDGAESQPCHTKG